METIKYSELEFSYCAVKTILYIMYIYVPTNEFNIQCMSLFFKMLIKIYAKRGLGANNNQNLIST